MLIRTWTHSRYQSIQDLLDGIEKEFHAIGLAFGADNYDIELIEQFGFLVYKLHIYVR